MHIMHYGATPKTHLRRIFTIRGLICAIFVVIHAAAVKTVLQERSPISLIPDAAVPGTIGTVGTAAAITTQTTAAAPDHKAVPDVPAATEALLFPAIRAQAATDVTTAETASAAPAAPAATVPAAALR